MCVCVCVCVLYILYMVTPPPRVIYPFGGEIVCILPLNPSLVQGLLCMCVCVHSEPPCMCSTKAIAQMVEYIVFAQSVSPIQSRGLNFNTPGSKIQDSGPTLSRDLES